MDLKIIKEVYVPLIMEVVDKYKNNLETITEKGDKDFVTNVDLAIEKELIKKLKDLDDKYGFISEEGVYEEKEINWVIDPIDGTNNMMNNFDFTTSVALVSNSRVIVGIIYFPSQKTAYFALNGKGSYKMTSEGVIRLKVKDFPKGEGVSIVGMPYNENKIDRNLRIIKECYKMSADVKRIGPASLDICRVAEGKAKLYIEMDLKPWDYYAGKLILTEAGGFFVQLYDVFVFSAKKY